MCFVRLLYVKVYFGVCGRDCVYVVVQVRVWVEGDSQCLLCVCVFVCVSMIVVYAIECIMVLV